MEEKKKNRLTKYLVPKLDAYLFGELSEQFLEETGTADCMAGVPFPVRKTHLTQEAFSAVEIARDMAFVLGCDPDFRYRENYLAFLHKLFSAAFVQPLLQDGARAADKKDYLTACIYSRAALAFLPEDRDAMLFYGLSCHDAYEAEEDGDELFVGDFKAEALEVFERLSVVHPDCADAWYYLGYFYLNMGLYIKSRLTFRQFLALAEASGSSEGVFENTAEIRELEASLKDPCILEEGCNAAASGRFESAIEILSDYEGREEYNRWWPLWYYLGISWRGLGRPDQAIEKFRQALRCSPSNRQVMDELIPLYEETGDAEMAEKYRRKSALVAENEERDREQKRMERGAVVS
ncbi:MAG: tetratricopeptide repeat protein [Firmicutes bacterium]|nr:tetratricopeptide repeat protein [Bacillota bacterium]